MIRAVVFACILVLTACTTNVEALAADRLALLIGNSRYEHATPLRNPENDVRLIEQALQKAGFTVFTGANLSRAEMLARLDAFVAAAEKTKDPTLLLYFAGHGVRLDDVNYILPVDAKIEDAKILRSAAIRSDDLLDRLTSVRAALTMLVLDACRDDPFENRTRGLGRGLSMMPPRANNLIAFSTAPGQVAQDGDAGTSPYASALAESMLIPGLRLEDMFGRVRLIVSERTKGAQVPWENSSLTAPFAFVAKQGAPALSKAEEDYWNLASMVNSPEGYQKYLELYPNGAFVSLAKLKVEALNKDFAYRRKAEIFPILMIEGIDYSGCTGEWDAEEMLRFENRIIFLKVTFSRRPQSCPDKWISLTSHNCNFWQEPGSRFNDLSCNPVEPANPELPTGGISISDGYSVLQIPFDDSALRGRNRSDWDWYFLESYLPETDGLVRMRRGQVEDGRWIYFERIDPASIGVTWKFENTLNALSSAKLPDEVIRIRMGEITQDQSNELNLWVPPAPQKSEPATPSQAIASELPDGVPSKPPEPRSLVLHDNYEVPNGGFGAPLVRIALDACRSACLEDQRCLAFTYYRRHEWCFLKAKLSGLRPQEDAITGVTNSLGSTLLHHPIAPEASHFTLHGGFELHGGYYRSPLTSASYEQCYRSCGGDRNCAAFTYERRTESCFFKSSITALKGQEGATSGVAISPGSLPLEVSSPSSPKEFTLHDNHDLFGGDYGSPLKDVSYESCHKTCTDDQQCMAFTYDRRNNWCFLKSSVSALKAHRGAVSGILEAAKPAESVQAQQ